MEGKRNREQYGRAFEAGARQGDSGNKEGQGEGTNSPRGGRSNCRLRRRAGASGGAQVSPTTAWYCAWGVGSAGVFRGQRSSAQLLTNARSSPAARPTATPPTHVLRVKRRVVAARHAAGHALLLLGKLVHLVDHGAHLVVRLRRRAGALAGAIG